jgi:hypothetical protein
MQPHQPPSPTEAARQARAWIDERHQHSRELVARLLRVAPEPAIAKALDQLATGELDLLARQLAAGAGLEVDLRAGTVDPA